MYQHWAQIDSVHTFLVGLKFGKDVFSYFEAITIPKNSCHFLIAFFSFFDPDYVFFIIIV